jgi:hypothetical protein
MHVPAAHGELVVEAGPSAEPTASAPHPYPPKGVPHGNVPSPGGGSVHAQDGAPPATQLQLTDPYWQVNELGHGV